MYDLEKKSPLAKIIENPKVCIGLMAFAIVYDLFYSIPLAFIIGENPMSFTMSMIGRATILGRFPTLFVFFGMVTNIAFLININYAYHKNDFTKTKLGKLGYASCWLGALALTWCTLIPSIEKEEATTALTKLQLVGHWSGALLFAIFFAIAVCVFIFAHRKKYKGFTPLFWSLLVVLAVILGLLLKFNKNGVIEIIPLILFMLVMALINAGVFKEIGPSSQAADASSDGNEQAVSEDANSAQDAQAISQGLDSVQDAQDSKSEGEQKGE